MAVTNVVSRPPKWRAHFFISSPRDPSARSSISCVQQFVLYCAEPRQKERRLQWRKHPKMHSFVFFPGSFQFSAPQSKRRAPLRLMRPQMSRTPLLQEIAHAGAPRNELSCILFLTRCQWKMRSLLNCVFKLQLELYIYRCKKFPTMREGFSHKGNKLHSVNITDVDFWWTYINISLYPTQFSKCYKIFKSVNNHDW